MPDGRSGRLDPDRDRGIPVLDRVVEQVDEHLLDAIARSGRLDRVARDLDGDTRVRCDGVHGRPDDGADVDQLGVDGEAAAVELGGEQDVVRDLAEPRRLRGDHLQQLAAPLRLEHVLAREQRLRGSVDGRHRRAQLV